MKIVPADFKSTQPPSSTLQNKQDPLLSFPSGLPQRWQASVLNGNPPTTEGCHKVMVAVPPCRVFIHFRESEQWRPHNLITQSVAAGTPATVSQRVSELEVKETRLTIDRILESPMKTGRLPRFPEHSKAC